MIGPGIGGLQPETRPPATAVERGGFALAIVVLLLFAIGVAGATGYQIVRLEALQTIQANETGQALAVAHAGLQRFIGEQTGSIPDTVAYSINGGQAIVTARKIGPWGTTDTLYLVTSTGTYSDPRYADVPATRTVHQHAIHVQLPLQQVGAMVSAVSNRVDIESTFTVDGNDQATTLDCAEAGTWTLGGAISGGNIRDRGGTMLGSPPSDDIGNRQDVLDTLATRWDVLTDPDFPVTLEDNGNWVTWMSTLPADSFPVVRVDGNLRADWNEAGRGVLIVTGRLTIRYWFEWDGIILAGSMADPDGRSWGYFDIDGMLVWGLEEDGSGTTDMDYGSVIYHSCNVLAAGRALAHLQALDNTWWESY